MTELGRRVPTAIAYGTIVLACVFGPLGLTVALAAALALLAARELQGLRAAGALPVALLALVLASGMLSLVALRALGSGDGAVAWPVWIVLAIVPTWAADIAAYAVGKRWGRRRLAPRISPGKTWEGTAAGFVAAAAAALVVAAAGTLSPWPALAVALLVGPAGLAGDLLESWIKRRAGVKDSGALLPGHGGVLDRVDSLIAVAPLVLLVGVLSSWSAQLRMG